MGDTKLYALFKIMDKQRQRIIIGLGINLPTGNITETGATLLGNNQRLAYPMQLGTGTYDLLPSITYVGQKNAMAWGTYAGANIKTMTNTQNYSWGNEFNVSGWVAYKWLPYISSSLRLEGISTETISGYDKSIVTLMNNDPNANTANFGGQKANIYLGLNFYKYKCSLKGTRLLIEYGIPVYQNLNGPQMSMHSLIQAGLQYTF